MKKIFVVSAVFTLALSAVSFNTALAQTDVSNLTAQVDSLKSILQGLQEKLKNLRQSGENAIENKAINITAKVENGLENLPTSSTLLLNQLKRTLGRQKLEVIELGNGRNEVNIQNAVITEIDATNLIIKAKLFGLLGRIHVLPDTKIAKESRATSTLNAFAVGDAINVWGIQDQSDPTLIQAKIVRNVSITRKEEDGRNRICIQIIVQAQNPSTGETKTFATPCAVPEGWKIIKPASQSGASSAAGTATSSTSTNQ